jgi:hypothetical protein
MAYCSAADVKTYLGISGAGDDTLLGKLIERAQQAIDSYTQRTFEASADTERTFDTERDVDGPTLWLDEDLCSIATITNGDGTEVTSSEYTTEPRNRTPYYAIRLLSSANIIWETDTTNYDHEDSITVEGKWAYSTSAPADIVHACIRLASYYYRQKDAQVFDTTVTPELGIITVPQGMPRDIENVLAPYKRIVL